jgi:hypothetical protein
MSANPKLQSVNASSRNILHGPRLEALSEPPATDDTETGKALSFDDPRARR